MPLELLHLQVRMRLYWNNVLYIHNLFALDYSQGCVSEGNRYLYATL